MTAHEVEVARLKAMIEEKAMLVDCLRAENDDRKERERKLRKAVTALAIICALSAILSIVRTWI